MLFGFNTVWHSYRIKTVWAQGTKKFLQFERCTAIMCKKAFYGSRNMERYRSGHNGADSKSVCEKSHAGSNPALSAKQTAVLTNCGLNFTL